MAQAEMSPKVIVPIEAVPSEWHVPKHAFQFKEALEVSMEIWWKHKTTNAEMLPKIMLLIKDQYF